MERNDCDTVWNNICPSLELDTTDLNSFRLDSTAARYTINLPLALVVVVKASVSVVLVVRISDIVDDGVSVVL
jgi:hypothetical protein